MSIDKLILNRRLFLKCGTKGLATLVGLPYLASIYANKAYSQNLNNGKNIRFVCMYHPHGVMQTNPANNIDGFSFFPKRNSETNYNLAQSSVKNLQERGLRDHVTLIEGLTTGGGSGNAHMQGISCFLSGATIPKDSVRKHKISFETHFGNLYASHLPERSIFLAGNPQLDKPNHNRYYNPLKNALSFDNDGNLKTPQMNQKTVFDNLFRGIGQQQTQQGISKRDQLKVSVLDSVKESRDALLRKVNNSDKRILDNYFTRLRELERKLSSTGTTPVPTNNSCKINNNNFRGLKNHDSKNMIHNLDSTVNNAIEIIALAFTCDRLRSVAFMFSGEASESTYTHIGVNAKIHGGLSHYKNVNKIDNTTKKHRQVDRYHAEKIGELAEKLEAIKEADGKSVLYNSVIVSGSGLGTGYNHSLNNLPVMVLGHGGGGIRGGRFLQQRGKGMGLLYSSILKAIGARNTAFGDNRGGATFDL